MLFNSLIFIGVFLPITLMGWYGLQKLNHPEFAKTFMVLASFVFYGYYNPRFILILLASLLFNFCFSRLLFLTQKENARKILLTLGITGNVGMLFYFKYVNFFLDSCNFLLHTDWHIEGIALPLGISFFTFTQISFLIDTYRGAPRYSLLDYTCYITFFPPLISGPILRQDEFLPQLTARKNRKIDTDLFFDGLALFILGLSKKVLLADTLAVVVNAEYENIYYLDAPSAWITIIFYMLELYFDFSGYSDMARGIAKLFGFVLPENFNSPLMATSVKDFWRRWHMTLSRFLTSYIYIPLGGNRKGTARKCLNLLIVFLVSGLWHGANVTFLVWGLLHGLAMVWETLFPRLRFRSDKLNRLVTGIYVTLAFSVFRSDSLAEAWLLFQRLFAGGFRGFFVGLCNTLQITETYVIKKALELLYPAGLNPFYIACTLLLLFVSLFFVAGPKAEDWIETKGRTKKGLFLLATLFTWSFLSLSKVSTFLYFNF